MQTIITYILLFFSMWLFIGCSPSVDVVQSLDGQWELTANDRIENASTAFTDGVPITLPLSLDLPATLTGPDTKSVTLPSSGYVWIQKSFELKTIPEGDIALQIGEIMNADRTYCNGVHIGSSGRFPPHFKSAWNQFRHYTINKDILKKGENRIAIRIYYDAEFWINAPVYLVSDSSGRIAYSYINFLRIHLMQALFFIMITLSIFFMVMYYYQKEYLEYLFFGLSCFTVAFPQLLHFFENLYPDLPYSSDFVLKLSQPGLIFFPAFLNLFYRYHVGRNKKWITILYIAIPVLFTVLLLFQQSRNNILFVRNNSIIISVLFMIDLFIASAMQLIQHKKAGWLIFIGIVPMVVLGLHDVMAFGLKIIPASVVLYVYGLPFLIIIIAIYLVKIFINALRQSQELNIRLQNLLSEIKKLAFLEKELEIARSIQTQLLPSSIPEIKGLAIAVKFQPALKIGGDIYNIFQLKDGVVIFIADVVGHGIPAAMIASMVNILFKMFQMLSVDPGLLLRSLNVNICNMLPQTFVTAVSLYINSYEKFLRIARAGHPSIIVQNSNGNINEYMPKGKALGLKTDNLFETLNISVSSGDRILIYTDGIVEAINKNNDMFGNERLLRILNQTKECSVKETLEIIYDELIEFVRDPAALDDDITMIMVKVE